MISQFLLSSSMIFLVFLFPLANHPLLMGLIILMLTFLVSITLGLSSLSTWLSYVLVLILLGGLLVIFIYVSLLASNETQIPQQNKTKIMIGGGVSSLISSLVYSSSIKILDSKTSAFSVTSHSETENLNWLYCLYSEQLGGVTIFLVFYLLLTLIVVVFITKNDFSSLRAR